MHWRGIDVQRREALLSAAGAALSHLFPLRTGGNCGVSLFDYLPAAQHRAIATGRTDYDCSSELQRALHETASNGTQLNVPRGTYLLFPSHRLEHADPHFECLAAIRMMSRMKLVCEPGTSFKMASGYSTDQNPRAMAMFGSTEVLQNVQIKGAILDMNGRANPISPNRTMKHFNRFPQAQIFVSSRAGVEPARIDHCHIANTAFQNANGVSCIVMGQSETRKAPLGRDWCLEDCAFYENGLDTDDHSSIYAFAEDVSVSRCVFANQRSFDGVGVNTAYEVHGSRQKISECCFENMLRGIWVANNYSSITEETHITHNTFRTVFYGIDFFHDRADAESINDTKIDRNFFVFDDKQIASFPGLDFKSAVQIASDYGQRGIAITNNLIVKTGHTITSAFLVVTGGALGETRHTQILASNNRGRGLTFGSFLRTARTAGIGQISIVDNEWSDLAPSDLMAIAAGDAVERTVTSQLVRKLKLGGGTTAAEPGHGGKVYRTFINTTIEALYLKPSQSLGIDPTQVNLGSAGIVLTRWDSFE